MTDARAVISAPEVSEDASEYEKKHVHAVYDEIASHFSSTRYKPWPIVSAFISSLATGSIGLDLGCGNGKYLSLPAEDPSRIRMIGMDRSINLLRFARAAGTDMSEVLLGDVIQFPWRNGAFDFVISIATIHHLATHSRRVHAVKTAIRAVVPHRGRILIYVWAEKQDDQSKRAIPRNTAPDTPVQNTPSSREGVDVFVPWVRAANPGKSQSAPSEGKESPEVYHRYYHMFAEGELVQLVSEAADELRLKIGSPNGETMGKGLTVVQEGWERSNYYIELLSWQNT